MREPVFRALEILAKVVVLVTGTRISYQGRQHIPKYGGAVIAINHTSYIDWLPVALAANQRGRRLRIMIKAEMQQIRVMNFLMKHTRSIPVDRSNGSDAYEMAVQRLREGELVAVYPEGTISRDFTLQEFKTGAVRMAAAADVPIIPVAVWGAHRIWTKDRPLRPLRGRVTVRVGKPEPPLFASMHHLTHALRTQMQQLLEEIA